MEQHNRQGDVVNPQASGVSSQARDGGVARINADGSIIPNDSLDLVRVAFGLRIENVVDGNTIKVDFTDGSTATFTLKEFEQGEKPWIVKRVYATGTSSTLKIFGLY